MTVRLFFYSIAAQGLFALGLVVLILLASCVSGRIRESPRRRRVAVLALLAAWALVVLDRVGWAWGWPLAGFLASMRVSTWLVSTLVFMTVGGAVGIATAWRRKDLVGHVILVLAAGNYILVHMCKLGNYSEFLESRSVIDLLHYSPFQMLIVSIATWPVMLLDLRRMTRSRPTPAEGAR
jgi:hypothetical protein